MLELTVTGRTIDARGEILETISVWAVGATLDLYPEAVLESLARVELARFYGSEVDSYSLTRDYVHAVSEYNEALYRVSVAAK